MALQPDRRSNLARLAAAMIAFAFGLGALAVSLGPAKYSSYAGHSPLIGVLAVVAGFGLIAVGLVSTSGRPAARIGDLALLAGFVWFAPIWIGWAGGPPLVRSVGMVVSGFAFALLVHLVLAYPSGRVQPRLVELLVVAVYLEATVSAIGRALFRDPILDVNACWNNCQDNVFLVHPFPGLARGIQIADLWFAAAASLALAAVCIWRLGVATRPARRAVWPILAAGVLLAATTTARSVKLARVALAESSLDPAFLAIFAAGCVAVILLSTGLLWAAFRAREQRRVVGRIVAGLGEAPSPGSLESALAGALGDPELRIAYWLPGTKRYVDALGHPVAEPVAAHGRAVTALVREGGEVAVVSHKATVPELEREIGAAVRLALENERLRAEVLSQLEDLRSSRTRIVEAGDEERRRLERDLHDGAQQRLLALSYDIRLAHTGAQADGDAEAASLLTHAGEQTLGALEELRELAHGIYPAILTEAGLGPAIATLADTATLPVEVADVPPDRYPAAVETAAYVVVADALEEAGGREAGQASVSARREDGILVVQVDDDGAERTDPMVQLADRVGALGGSVEVGPRTLRAQIPCE